jgi:hypothetical protein
MVSLYAEVLVTDFFASSKMALYPPRRPRVAETFYEINGPWQACMLKVSVARFYDLHPIPAFIPYPPLASALYAI